MLLQTSEEWLASAGHLGNTKTSFFQASCLDVAKDCIQDHCGSECDYDRELIQKESAVDR